MIHHPELHVLVVTMDAGPEDRPWPRFGEDIPWLRVTRSLRMPDTSGDFDAVITTGSGVSGAGADRLLRFVRGGGAWLAMIGDREEPLPDAFGVRTGKAGAAAELRVLFTDASSPLAARLPDAVYLSGRHHPMKPTASDCRTLLYTDWHYTHEPVFVVRPSGDGHLACTTIEDFSSSMMRQVVYRLLRHWRRSAPSPETSLGVGILGYAPSVGLLHGLGANHTPGLRLEAACDLNPDRLVRAVADFPGIETHDTAESMAGNPDVDLVIVATPPNTHAALSIQMMDSGKHVLCEKPLALNRRETDAMQDMAEQRGVHLSCHQNRRWDVDFLTIRDCVAGDRIGDLFYMETFVGGFHHPCGYWHSHAPVSGGTSYDWGAHYIDWIVGLMPHAVTAVIGTRHKRVWHDVTNADQERIQIRFAGGREAEFLHSDIAGVRKPKWYLLGTRGAILGEWRDVTAVSADPVHYFHRTEIPATETAPEITLSRRTRTGEIEQIRPAAGKRDPFAFHRNLADHLLWGDPLAAPLQDSVTVVAVLEAAARSMANGGSVETIDGG